MRGWDKCLATGCGQRAYARGWCAHHYSLVRQGRLSPLRPWVLLRPAVRIRASVRAALRFGPVYAADAAKLPSGTRVRTGLLRSHDAGYLRVVQRVSPQNHKTCAAKTDGVG